jgi:hypothetical protein
MRNSVSGNIRKASDYFVSLFVDGALFDAHQMWHFSNRLQCALDQVWHKRFETDLTKSFSVCGFREDDVGVTTA